jgi:hypothetical protein
MPVNYPRWGLILSILGIGIAGVATVASITVPEVRCFLRLEPCPTPPEDLVDFKLVVVTEELKPLESVEVVFTPRDLPPETKMTNSDGYVQIAIPKKGDIEVKLTKEEYKTLTRTINLSIEPERTRTFILKRDDIGQSSPTPTTINTISNSSTKPIVSQEPECIHKSLWKNPSAYSGNIIVDRTIQKPDQQIYFGENEPYSVVCTVANNTGNIKFIYAIPDNSGLKKVKVSLYLDSKLSQSLIVTRGSLVPLSFDTKNVSSYAIEHIVLEGDGTGKLYTIPTSGN